MIFPYRKLVVAFLGMGPKQPDIDPDESVEPSAFSIFNVAQKAKDVLIEPVLLLIANVKGFVM